MPVMPSIETFISRNNVLLLCLLYLSFLIPSSGSVRGGDDTIITTYFHLPDQEPRARFFFNSLQASNPRSTLSPRYRHHFKQDTSATVEEAKVVDHRYYIHACVSGVESLDPAYYQKVVEVYYVHFGVVLHPLHDMNQIELLASPTVYEGGKGQHQSSRFHNNKNDTSWMNLICLSQLADYFFVRDVIDVNIFFIGMNFISVGNLRSTFLEQVHASQAYQRQRQQNASERHRRGGSASSTLSLTHHRQQLPKVFCLPRMIPRLVDQSKNSIEASTQCELDLFLLPSRIGTEWSGLLNYTTILPNITAHDALDMTIHSITSGIEFFEQSDSAVVRAGRFWIEDISQIVNESVGLGQSASPYNEYISLVEFDDVEHKVAIENCQIQLFIEWDKIYRTLRVITETLATFYERYPLTYLVPNRDCQSIGSECGYHYDTVMSQTPLIEEFVGCKLINYNEHFPPERREVDVMEERFYPWSRVQGKYEQPRIFEIILINDEISLFQLRMQYLHDHVNTERNSENRHILGPDYHIVLEGVKSFTGRDKKCHFNTSRDMLHKLGSYHGNNVIHVMLSSLYRDPIKESKDVWLNEYFSRNMGGYTIKQALGAKPTDVMILTDIDEIPHRRTYETLRALYAFDPSTGLPKTLHPRIHRYYPRYYMYDFDCQVNKPELLTGTAVVASRIDIAEKLRNSIKFLEAQSPKTEIYTDIDSDDNFVTLTRMFVQSHHPYRLEDVLYPGGWHFSFFGGLKKIKNKLESYSHQNFAKHLIENRRQEEEEVEGQEVGELQRVKVKVLRDIDHPNDADSDTTTTTASHKIVVDSISIDKVIDKIAAGQEIDYRNQRQCYRIPFKERDDHAPAPSLSPTATMQLVPPPLDKETQWLRDTYDSIELRNCYHRVRVAFVSGHIGEGYAILPPRPSYDHNCYFITNNPSFVTILQEQGWIPILIVDLPLNPFTNERESQKEEEEDTRVDDDSDETWMIEYNTTSSLSRESHFKPNYTLSSHTTFPYTYPYRDDTDRVIFNSFYSKLLKVFPQYFLSTEFNGRIGPLLDAWKKVLDSERESLLARKREREERKEGGPMKGGPSSVREDERVRESQGMSMLLKLIPSLNPEELLSRYDYVIWFDNKFTLRTRDIFQQLLSLSYAMVQRHRQRETNSDSERMRALEELVDSDFCQQYLPTTSSMLSIQEILRRGKLKNTTSTTIDRDSDRDSNTMYHVIPSIMYHRRPECCGGDIEFRASMYQERYQRLRPIMHRYIRDEVLGKGYILHGERHLQTGFILYNLHDKTDNINSISGKGGVMYDNNKILTVQSTWYRHIHRVGIQCQIAFYFVNQRFVPPSYYDNVCSNDSLVCNTSQQVEYYGNEHPKYKYSIVQEYIPEWHNGRMSLTYRYDDE